MFAILTLGGHSKNFWIHPRTVFIHITATYFIRLKQSETSTQQHSRDENFYGEVLYIEVILYIKFFLRALPIYPSVSFHLWSDCQATTVSFINTGY
jgi:hypothetical protein